MDDDDSDNEDDQPSYEFRFEAAKLLLELDDNVETASMVSAAASSFGRLRVCRGSQPCALPACPALPCCTLLAPGDDEKSTRASERPPSRGGPAEETVLSWLNFFT